MRAGKPSHTAYKVAISVVALGADPIMGQRLPKDIAEASADVLIGAGVSSEWFVRACQAGKMRGFINFMGWLVGPAYTAVYRGIGERKIFCERQVRTAISEGAQQVLVLGAGYDTLAWRLAPEFPQVRFLEIDHPATAHGKWRALEKMGGRENLELFAADLAQTSLASVLAQSCWDNQAKSVFLAEGLLMYLSPQSVLSLLDQCAEICAPGSRLAFDHFFQDHNGRLDLGRATRIYEFMLKLVGEPFLWSTRGELLPQFLAESAWKYAPELVGEPNNVKVLGFAVLMKT